MDPHAMLTELKPIRRRRVVTGRRLCIAACLALAAAAIAAIRLGWFS